MTPPLDLDAILARASRAAQHSGWTEPDWDIFVRLARTDIPALVARIRELEAAQTVTCKVCGELRYMCECHAEECRCKP